MNKIKTKFSNKLKLFRAIELTRELKFRYSMKNPGLNFRQFPLLSGTAFSGIFGKRTTTRGISKILANLIREILFPIDQFRYIKTQPKTIDLSTRLVGINTEFVGFIPKSLVLRSVVLG